MPRSAQSRIVSVRRPRKIELHQACGFNVIFVKLRNDVGAALLAIERREIGEHRGCDHHATGMLAGVARQALERARHVDECTHFVIFAVQALEFRLFLERFVERHLQFKGNQLGDAIDHAIGVTLHAANIAHHRFGCHGAVGDDLGDALGAILGSDILNDPVAPRHAEVDVEVGHRDTLRIQKALEQQVVAQRINIHNAQCIGHERTRP